MLVATYSIHKEAPWVRPGTHTMRAGKWQIRVFAQCDDDMHMQTITHDKRCALADLMQVASDAVDEILAELGMTVTDAGFQVIKLR